MAMSVTERERLLSSWIKPSSDDEKGQQDRAERMVTKAIEASSSIDMSDVSIYTKGSYPNNTNVRRDSDVDVVVQQTAVQYYDYLQGVEPAGHPGTPYTGEWSPTKWRATVADALIDYYGASSIDSSGKVAINVSAVAGSRPSADVVPSFNYVRYDDPHRQVVHEGSCVFPRDSFIKIVNWPAQQFTNGRNLNTRSSRRYKRFVRALKNAENKLVADGAIKDLPSYFMECLVYNVPVSVLTTGFSLSEGFKATLINLHEQLDGGTAYDKMVEPNDLKWLFKGHQKWNVDDGKSLILETWNYLGYGG